MRKLLPLLLLFILFSCQTESRKTSVQDPVKSIELITPTGESIKTTVVGLPKDQEQGLSGVRSEDFADDQGMLFFYTQDDEKHFWMPDTYFDLDIHFLDKDLKIVDIIRKLPFYVGRANPDLIPRARPVWSRHALEMKASSPLSNKLKVGDVLKWKSQTSAEEAEKHFKKVLGIN